MATGTIKTQKSDLGTPVSISEGTTYWFPSDGYLVLQCGWRANVYTAAYITNHAGSGVIRYQVANGSQNQTGITSIPVFVRAGMGVTVSHIGTDGAATFVPFV
jgi:hypothetical protein